MTKPKPAIRPLDKAGRGILARQSGASCVQSSRRNYRRASGRAVLSIAAPAAIPAGSNRGHFEFWRGRRLGSDPGRSHYHEDKDILVAVGLRGGLDPFRQGEESFCQRRVNTYGILQKRVGKTCEDQGPSLASLARLHLFFACHGLGFGASARP